MCETLCIGPFDAVFCVGAFFDGPSDDEGAAADADAAFNLELKAYVDGSASAPIPTYFVEGLPAGREFCRDADGRGLHSSTFRLNVSAFCGMGDCFWKCQGSVEGVFGGIRVYFVSESAQVELKSGLVPAPGRRQGGTQHHVLAQALRADPARTPRRCAAGVLQRDRV